MPSVDELTEQQQATNHPTAQTSLIVGCFLAIASVLGSSRFILDQVLMFEVFFTFRALLCWSLRHLKSATRLSIRLANKLSLQGCYADTKSDRVFRPPARAFSSRKGKKVI